MSKKKINVVAIGGGNGGAVVARALKIYTDKLNISAVVPMSDSGGSSGRLRKELNTLPPGDIMRVILGFSQYDSEILKNIFYRVRFSNNGKTAEHNLGNLFLALTEKYCGNYMEAIRALEEAIGALGKTYPVTLDSTHLAVELNNGKIIKTEALVDRPDYDRKFKIKKAYLDPTGSIYSEAKEALEKADYIILGPGSLYTSIVAALLPKGVKEAINKSKAKLVYVTGSIYQKKGETGPERLSDFVKQLQNYLPRKIDVVLYNVHKLNNMEKKKYKVKNWAIFPNDIENIPDYKIIGKEYESSFGTFEPKKLGRILIGLLKAEKA